MVILEEDKNKKDYFNAIIFYIEVDNFASIPCVE